MSRTTTTIATTFLACTTMAAAPPPPPPPPASPLSLQPPPSSPAPVTAPATTRVAQRGVMPAPHELHEQAIEAMRLGRLHEAFELMEKAFNATPAAQRTRPLVLNRAILDLTQRVHVMRAVREIAEYLRDHPEPDEQAHNILGAALNIAAGTPRWKQGALWQSAYREWERRNDEMNAARPGYRRWGPHWLDEQQFQNLERDRNELARAADEQAVRVNQARNRLDALKAQHQSLAGNIAADREQGLAVLEERRQIASQRSQYEMQKRAYEQQKRAYEQWLQRQPQQRPPSAPHGQPPPPAPQPPAPQQPAPAPQQPAPEQSTPQPSTPQQSAQGSAGAPPLPPTGPPPAPIDPYRVGGVRGSGDGGMVVGGPFPAAGAYEAQARIAGDIVVAQRELDAEVGRLNSLKARQAGLARPTWPATFDPIDPAALTAPPSLPPDPNAIAALVQQTTREQERVRSPFGVLGTTQPAPQSLAPPPAIAPAPSPVAAGSPAPALSPATAPSPRPPLQVPFGPREVDKQRGR